MNNDDQPVPVEQRPDNRREPRRVRDFFSVPAPVKRVFDRFPLVTYPANDLPHHSKSARQGNQLFVFTDAAGARRGRPSFNPQCLKWQAYLKFVKIEFDIVPSNNHASPSGFLPFLLPDRPVGSSTPIPSNKLQKWIIEQVHCEEEQQLNVRFEVYSSLLDIRIRNAWLYHLYMNRENFEAVARRLYVDPTTTNSAVRSVLAAQLQQAAREELLKTTTYIDVSALEAEAAEAFQSLSELLGDRFHFFDRPEPGLFDASVFAYTHLILDQNMGWKYNNLEQSLSQHTNLVQHRDRLLEYFKESEK
ncbi:putative mitochondrial outer membrane protein (Sam35) [Aspergillus stella-maris]|uniref:putative mitochondrial outer membrane protein (Sam35) n=1 Tax=Aspergillus stella-maris TaxID=1810926 RepID=UPI003CCD081D